MDNFEFLFIFLIGVLALGSIVLWIWAIIDCVNNPALDSNRRIVWILIIIFLQALGALIYFIARPRVYRDLTGPPGPGY